MLSYQPRLSYASLSEQEVHQFQALQQLLIYLHKQSPFYSRQMAPYAGHFAQLKSLADIQHLPTTSKADMQAHNMDFLCVPKQQVKEYMATSGTLGKPVTIALTAADLQRLAYNEHQSFRCAGGNPDDIYQLMLTLDRQFMAGMAYYSGIRELGAALVRTGPGLPALQWETIQRLGTNSLVTVPSFLIKMLDFADEHGIDLAKMPVQKAVCIGESLRRADFSLSALGSHITRRWPIQLYSTYAATEMQTAFTECSAGKGGHHQPDLIIAEILDDAGNPLPDGVPGEVTITTLGVEAMPLLRYRTGDMAALHNEPCACGRSSKRLGPIIGRKLQMIKYKGTTLYPPAIFDILNEADCVDEYVVEVFTAVTGTDELRLHLHSPLTADDCEQKLRPLLQARLRVAPALLFHSATDMHAMQFPPGSRKVVKFLDNRVDGWMKLDSVG